MIPSTPHSPKSAISRGSFTVHTFTFTPVAWAAFTISGDTYVRLGCSAQRRIPRALSISDDRSGESAKMNARRTAGPATRHPSSAAHQKLDTYASGSRRSARSLPTEPPVSWAALSLIADLRSTFTPSLPRQKSSTSWSVSFRSGPGRSWEIKRRPSSASHTSVSISSHPSSSAFANDSIVFSGECPLAPRWPIRRTALASHIPATHNDEGYSRPGDADRDQRGNPTPVVLRHRRSVQGVERDVAHPVGPLEEWRELLREVPHHCQCAQGGDGHPWPPAHERVTDTSERVGDWQYSRGGEDEAACGQADPRGCRGQVHRERADGHDDSAGDDDRRDPFDYDPRARHRRAQDHLEPTRCVIGCPSIDLRDDEERDEQQERREPDHADEVGIGVDAGALEIRPEQRNIRASEGVDHDLGDRGQESREDRQTESPRDDPHALLIHHREDGQTQKRISRGTPLDHRLAGRTAKEPAANVPTNEREDRKD